MSAKQKLFDEIKFNNSKDKVKPKPFVDNDYDDDDDNDNNNYNEDPLVKILSKQQEQLEALSSRRSEIDEDDKKKLAKNFRKAKTLVDKVIVVRQDKLEKKKKKEEERKIAEAAKQKRAAAGTKGKGLGSRAPVKNDDEVVNEVKTSAKKEVVKESKKEETVTAAPVVYRPNVGRIVQLNIPEKSKNDVLSSLGGKLLTF